GGRVVDSPIATVTADADIVVRGRAAEEITVTGPIIVHRAEFRIAERLPPNLPTLQVRETGGNAQQRAASARAAQVARNAEGARDLRRGTFEVAGQRLNFSRGTLSFDPGAGIDPTLDLDASTNAGGVTANIHIGGHASAPTFTLTSDPNLPPDEILSHMLFGT